MKKRTKLEIQEQLKGALRILDCYGSPFPDAIERRKRAEQAAFVAKLPCPFCGAYPNSCLRQSHDEFGECEYAYHEIECVNQDCGMRPIVAENLQADDGEEAWSMAFERAAAAWNQRAKSPETKLDPNTAFGHLLELGNRIDMTDAVALEEAQAKIVDMERKVQIRDAQTLRLEATVAEMTAALEDAARTFRNYAAMHLAKTPAAVMKAENNIAAAERLEKALASAPSGVLEAVREADNAFRECINMTLQHMVPISMIEAKCRDGRDLLSPYCTAPDRKA